MRWSRRGVAILPAFAGRSFNVTCSSKGPPPEPGAATASTLSSDSELMRSPMTTRPRFARRSIGQSPRRTNAAVEALEGRLLLHGAGHPSGAAIALAADAAAGTQLLPDLV